MIVQADTVRGIPLRDGSVQCVVTSPPYWGLRDYGVAGQLGMEPTMDEYVQKLVTVFREVWRVLRDDGTAWLNLGDSYCTHARGNREGDGATSTLTNPERQDKLWGKHKYRDVAREPRIRANGTLKEKDLCLIPARVALALQADGWWVRQEVIWSKPNPMPESVRDRPTRSHETVWLLAKSGTPKYWVHRDRPYWAGVYLKPKPDYRWVRRDGEEESREKPDVVDVDEHWRRVNLWRACDYYFDAEAIKTAPRMSSLERINQPNFDAQTGGPKDYANGTNGNRSMRRTLENYRDSVQARKARAREGNKSIPEDTGPARRNGIRPDKQRGHSQRHAGFNDRWDQMTTAEQMSMGANARSVWDIAYDDVWWIATRPYSEAHFATFPEELPLRCILAGTRPGDVVLDPFSGAGTTCKVARALGRRGIGLELKHDYCRLGSARESDAAPQLAIL